jgi:putative ABC transport system permease protein
VDFAILVSAVLVSSVTGMVMELAPALQAARVDQREAMQRSARGRLGTGGRFHGLLVASEICLAFLLTVTAGLLLKSFVQAWNVDPGFQVQNLYEVNFSLTGAKYQDEKVVVRAETEALKGILQIPGVESAGLVSTPPLAGSFGSFDQAGFVIQDRRIPDPQVPSVDRYVVSSDYFRAAGIPLFRGRVFNAADTSATSPVAVVSETGVRARFAISIQLRDSTLRS